jgi:ABC-2 type transport system ATP-binding protein
MSSPTIIEAEGLTKHYGAVQALDGLDLSVEEGSILALLGPNGAGKTTAVRILTTRTVPDAGRARVAGFDVVAQPGQVRRHIGVTAQDVTLDGLLTGRQNLIMAAQLSGLSRRDAARRATELLERFDLAEAGGRVAKGYSGGMRRRLDLATSLVASPPVLFLDEPTTGLDPNSRAGVWDIVRDLTAQGVTVLLTTQYLDEADQLAQYVVVVDHGRSIAEGTPAELKRSVGGALLELVLAEGTSFALVSSALAPFVSGAPRASEGGRRVIAPVPNRSGLATLVVRALDAADILVDDVQVHQPSLDDVFFALTGRPAEGADDVADAINGPSGSAPPRSAGAGGPAVPTPATSESSPQGLQEVTI